MDEGRKQLFKWQASNKSEEVDGDLDVYRISDGYFMDI